jgi:hypothetical protein
MLDWRIGPLIQAQAPAWMPFSQASSCAARTWRPCLGKVL